jgi:hypothetical protein
MGKWIMLLIVVVIVLFLIPRLNETPPPATAPGGAPAGAPTATTAPRPLRRRPSVASGDSPRRKPGRALRRTGRIAA